MIIEESQLTQQPNEDNERYSIGIGPWIFPAEIIWLKTTSQIIAW
jgi:hypothetical protein